MSVLSHSTADKLGIAISSGESINLSNSLSPLKQSKLKLTDAVALKSSLPPAVANVPPEHTRGYIHSKKVNYYMVGNTLGEGSFAKVKEAFHSLVGEKVAMKVIDKKKAQQDPYVAKNFRREAKLLQMVRHPNILQLLEVIETDSSFYLITELCSGGELMKYIYKKGHLEEDETRKFMRQIVSAVDHLHKAKIIHRDLKVENMLLDANSDIKLIDFGLSNEEYVQGENGPMHCNTQCGSPAYAAPELLGHKSYGPQVDIWSIGVNMYAMLTGCLPYTVEPFNITALHAKMLENKMNPIPDYLSPNCKDLLKKLLKSNPEERIVMANIMSHPWMNESHTLPFGPAPFPNKLQPADIQDDIIQHMIYILKLKDSEEDLIQELISNRSTQAGAIYHLLTARLARYQKQFRSHTRQRHRSTRVSRDQGYYEGDEDDSSSMVSMPTRLRKPSRQSSRGNIILRQNRPGAGKNRPISHPPVVEGEDQEETVKGYHYHRRRSTMPEMMLKEDLEKFHEYKRNKELAAMKEKEERSKQTSKRPLTRQNNSLIDSRNRKDPSPKPHDPYEYSLPNPPGPAAKSDDLAPIRHPPGRLRRNTFSTPAALNQLKHDLDSKLGPQNSSIPQAWHSNPSSRNPSRHGSRQPSSRMVREPSTHSRTSSFEIPEDSSIDIIEFHEVETSTFPRVSKKKRMFSIDSSDSISESSHLPSIREGRSSSWSKKRSHSDTSPEKKNGYQSHKGYRTELRVDEVLTEILRVATSLKMKEAEPVTGNRVVCTWGGVKIQISISKHDSVCTLVLQWISGGDNASYREKCEKLLKKIKL